MVGTKDEQIKRLQVRIGILEAQLRKAGLGIPGRPSDLDLLKARARGDWPAQRDRIAQDAGVKPPTIETRLRKIVLKYTPRWSPSKWLEVARKHPVEVTYLGEIYPECFSHLRSGVWNRAPTSLRQTRAAAFRAERRSEKLELAKEALAKKRDVMRSERSAWQRFDTLSEAEKKFCRLAVRHGWRPGNNWSIEPFSMAEFMRRYDLGWRCEFRGGPEKPPLYVSP